MHAYNHAWVDLIDCLLSCHRDSQSHRNAEWWLISFLINQFLVYLTSLLASRRFNIDMSTYGHSKKLTIAIAKISQNPNNKTFGKNDIFLDWFLITYPMETKQTLETWIFMDISELIKRSEKAKTVSFDKYFTICTCRKPWKPFLKTLLQNMALKLIFCKH